jgi:hypothetical protein
MIASKWVTLGRSRDDVADAARQAGSRTSSPGRPARNPFRINQLVILIIGVLLVTGLSACGRKSHPTEGDNEGLYIDAGPITYQVQLSRQLNPSSIEDRTYFQGVSSVATNPDQLWFGIFLWARNPTTSDQSTSDRFDIIDTQGNRYYPVPLNAQVNPFAWTAQTLAPKATQPAPGSIPFFSPTQAQELLFKLNESIYSNRPLTLEIYASGQAKPSTISLDL